MVIQQLYYIFGSNLIQCGLLCWPANVINSILHWLTYCEFVHKLWEMFHHTTFKHFTDASLQAVLMMLLLFKMSDEHQ